MTEFEFDPSVARMLDQYTGPPERSADWQDVLGRSGRVGPRRKRRTLLLAAALVALLDAGTRNPAGRRDPAYGLRLLRLVGRHARRSRFR